MHLKSITRLWYNLIPKLKWRRGGGGVRDSCCPAKFPTPSKIPLCLPYFLSGPKSSKNAFAQLQLSANLPILINPRKGGIRIQNAIR